MQIIRPARVLKAAAILVVSVLFVSQSQSALAATYDEASWYYTNFNMANNLKISNGSGIKIALIDGSIDPSVPELSNAKIETHPSECLLNGSSNPVNSTTDATHATQMAVVLAGNGTGNWDGRGGRGVAPGATILHYRNQIDQADGTGTECKNAQGTDVFDEATASAISDATAKGARVVNMSFGTDAPMPLTSEAMGEAESKGVVFIGSTYDKDTPNNPSRLNNPGQFNGVVLMNGLSPDSKPALNSSTSALVTMMAPGDQVVVGGFNPATGAWDSTGVFGGSSIAAAFTSGVVADAMSHWPKATGNQIIQLMLRTTGGKYHDIPTRTTDGFGFGTVSLTAMYEHDPTKLPDKNPLLRNNAQPSSEDIMSYKDSAEPKATKQPAKPIEKSHLPLILSVIIVSILIASVVLLFIFRRRRKADTTDGDTV